MRRRDEHQLDAKLLREKERQEHQRKNASDRARFSGSAKNIQRQAARHRQRSQAGRLVMTLAICAALLFFSGFLVWQLYQIQIVSHAANAEKAAGQHFMKVAELPRRGAILDRNGLELAGTTYVYRIGITPKDVRSITKHVDHATIASEMAAALDLDTEVVADALTKTEQMYVQLIKDATREQTDALRVFLRDKDIGGVRIDAEPKRYYTNGQLASQVIGFTRYGEDNLVGQLGVELYYNDILNGQPGYTYVETDNYGGRGELPFSAPTSLRAQDGQNVMLHIDVNIQKIVQEELEKAVKLYDITQGGIAIIMDPYTGAVLAMADYPYFSSEDPTLRPDVYAFDDWDDTSTEIIEYLSGSVWRNRAISDGYRPGSTMKTLTAAMSFEEAASSEDEQLIDAPMKVLGETITCYYKPGHGLQTIEQSFWKSCNPIFAQLSQRLGVERFYQYVHAFGLRDLTGIDLPAESTGLIHANPTELDMATFSYGESATITPMQMITAFSVFANGGHLVRPSIVRAVTDSKNQLISEAQPETVRKVMSEITAARTRELLKGVVLYGTGTRAYVEGYSIAGKTSTSTYVEGISVTGKATEDPDDYYSLSFASLAPADNPEIVALVVLHKPEDQKLSSGIAAAVNGRMVERILEYLGVAREYSDSDISRLSARSALPNVVGMTYAQASRTLSERGFRAQAGDSAMGDGTVVKAQWPQTGTELHDKSLVFLYPVDEPEDDEVVIPDFKGKNIHECIRSAAESGLNIEIIGNSLGLAVEQSPLSTFEQLNEQDSSEQNLASHEAGQDISDTDPADAPDADSADSDENGLITHLRRGSLVSVRFEAVEEQTHTSEDDDDSHEHDEDTVPSEDDTIEQEADSQDDQE